MAQRWRDATATIAAGASLSGPVNLGVGKLCGIQMPAVWTAANLTFQASGDGGRTYYNVVDSLGVEVVVIAGTSVFIPLNLTDFGSLQFLKVRSGTSGSPVVQVVQALVILFNRVEQ